MVMVTATVAERLPWEILQEIFDHLGAVDRKSASLVCRRWRQVLWSDRYIRRMVLSVTSASLDSNWALQRMCRPFRKVNITDQQQDGGSIMLEVDRKRFLARVRRLITSRVIRSSVQEMRLVVSHPTLNTLFGQQVGGAPIEFPKLTELTYSPGMSRRRIHHFVDVDPVVNVWVPKLSVLKIDVFTAAAVELIRMVSGQICSLSMRFVDKRKFLQVLKIESFDSLREATFLSIPTSGKEDYHNVLRSGEFNAIHRNNLAKLDKLEIRDMASVFNQAYGVIFRAAVNLSQLHVFGRNISSSALISIHDMKNLRRLHLYMY